MRDGNRLRIIKGCIRPYGSWTTMRPYATVEIKMRVAFSAISNWHAWHVSPNVSPAWLMQKIVPVESVDVEVISRRLQGCGLRVGTFNWPTTMDRVLSRAERPNAHYVATYGLDVPIHQEMNRREFELIGDALQRRCA